MEFLGMIAVGVLGLSLCGRFFVYLFKLMFHGFDLLEERTLGGGSSRRFRDD